MATANTFRRLALSMPDAVEGQHMGHPDFRVRGKDGGADGGRVFASLFERDGILHGAVGLNPGQQKQFVEGWPRLFDSIRNRDGTIGAWGRSGWTRVNLHAITGRVAEGVVRKAMAAARGNAEGTRATKRLKKSSVGGKRAMRNRSPGSRNARGAR